MGRRTAAYILLFLGSTSFASGLEFSGEYTADLFSLVSGGIATGTEYLDNLDLQLELDVAEIWNAGAGKLLVNGLYNNGSTFSAVRVGDLQGVSNIDAEEAWRLFEFWYEVGGTHWSVRTGLYDLNLDGAAMTAGTLAASQGFGSGRVT